MLERDKNKIYAIFILFCLLFSVIICRAFFIQIINKKKLLAYSEDQLIRKAVIFPNRGNIYDRNGHSMAINIQVYNIFSIPKMIKEKKKAFKRLSQIVPSLTLTKLSKTLRNRTRFTWIERQIKLDKKQVEEIKKQKGFFLEKTTKRFYPNHELMAQVLGFVGVDNIGLGGIEYKFNELLKGDVKIIKYLNDAKGRPIKFESYDTENKAKNVYLTLDKGAQAIAEKYLKLTVETHKATRGGVGIMDASNGEVLAIANYPSFDPNRLQDFKEAHRRLSFVTDPFEPGSIFKVFTVISALENKIVTPETSYFCEHGKLKVGNHFIKESDPSRKHEWLSVSDIIKYSSNIGTVKIAFDVTFPLLDKTIKDFGFGKKTNIQFPGESRGIYNDRGKTSQLSLSNLSFGQGMATTGIQVLAAYAAIANGGIYYPPIIIKTPDEKKGRRIMSSNIAQEIQRMLVSVVESGTAKNIKIPYFKISGKTGTAQKTDKMGKYTEYIPSFVGFPVGVEKKFVVFAYIEGPNGKFYSGSKVAAPIVKNVIEYMLFKNKEYQNLAFDSREISSSHIGPVLTKSSVDDPSAKGGMPRFIGLDKKSSYTLAKKIGVYLKHQGIGVVIKQNIKEGTPFSKDAVVILEHGPPHYE